MGNMKEYGNLAYQIVRNYAEKDKSERRRGIRKSEHSQPVEYFLSTLSSPFVSHHHSGKTHILHIGNSSSSLT